MVHRAQTPRRQARPSRLLLQLVARLGAWMRTWWQTHLWTTWDRFARRPPARARLEFESFEPRVLLSADLLPASAAPEPSTTPVEQRLVEAQGSNDDNPITIRWDGASGGVPVAATGAAPAGVSVQDADGTVAELQISGPGSASWQTSNGQLTLRIDGSTSETQVLLHTSGGDGRIGVHAIHAMSALGRAALGQLDLSGLAQFDGGVGTLELGQLQGAVVQIGGNGQAQISLADVHDSQLLAEGASVALQVDSWHSSSSGASRIDVAQLRSLHSGGDLEADLQVRGIGQTGYLLGLVQVAGAIDRGHWNVEGRANRITAQHTGAAWHLNVSGTLALLQTTADAAGQVSVAGLQMLLVGGAARELTLLVGADLGNDAAIGGSGPNADTFRPGTLARARIGGDMHDSLILVGVDPRNGTWLDGDDTLLGTATRHVQELLVGGQLTGSTRIVAPAFPGLVRVGGALVDPGTLDVLATRPVDTAAPELSARLAHDSGVSNTDGLTNDPSITGQVTDNGSITQLWAVIDPAQPDTPLHDVSLSLLAGGALLLDRATLDALAGGSLTDGAHTVRLVAQDADGNRSQPVDIDFMLDTQSPTARFGIAGADALPGSDTRSAAAIVQLSGQGSAGATVHLAAQGLSTLVGSNGQFQLAGVRLQDGDNTLSLRMSDSAGNDTTVTRTLTRVAQQQTDAVLQWNQVALQAVQHHASDPPIATRLLAMISLAQFDALAAIDGAPAYLVARSISGPASAPAAAAVAAHRILSLTYPAHQAVLDAALATSLDAVADGAARDTGIALGLSIADAIWALRATDGAQLPQTYTRSNVPGQWRPTGPMYEVADQPHWRSVQPFALNTPDALRPAPPPALDTAVYAQAVEQVKRLGSATSTDRSADQTEQALFWADGKGSLTPPGHWNAIAADVAQMQGNSLSANARLFAQLNVALADAAIACWDAKYGYDLWRPETAIQGADLDGNAGTTRDATWRALLLSPSHPEYVSGHSTFSMAAATVLAQAFGDGTAFSTTSATLPGVTRAYTSFTQAAQEAGDSRIYGGIHFGFSNLAGQQLGAQVAGVVLARFQQAQDTQAPLVVLADTPAASRGNVTVTGQVLDNLSGVAWARIGVDGGTPQDLALDADGGFQFTTSLATDGSADGRHTLQVSVQDAAGNGGSAVARSFVLDTRAPVIELQQPANGSVIDATTRVTGTVDGTGSAITSLRYRLGNDTEQVLPFQPLTGSFDAPLALGALPAGEHVLRFDARDAAGNVQSLSRTVTLAALPALTITRASPAASAIGVGVTQRPQVFFSRAVETSSLTADSFYATSADGQKLAATIVPAQDGGFAWLFFAAPMPGSASITLHVDGALVRAAADGALLDADGDGQAGGMFLQRFSTVGSDAGTATTVIDAQGQAQVTRTSLVGTVVDPGPDLQPMTFDDIGRGPDGIIHTSDDVLLLPIAHARVWILGQEDRFVFTDAQGRFELTDIPVGKVKLAIDGRTATNTPAGIFFPEMVMDLAIEAGLANTVMGSMGSADEQRANEERVEVYLPRVAQSMLQTVNAVGPTLVVPPSDAAPGLTPGQRQKVQLTVPAGAMVDENGQPVVDARIGIATVPPELILAMLPEGTRDVPITFTIQAPGVAVFTTPLELTLPNVYGAQPGEQLYFYSFDHASGTMVIEGTATVSADGETVTTDPGQGITKPGWHGFLSLLTLTDALTGAPCGNGALLREGAKYLINAGATAGALLKPIQAARAFNTGVETAFTTQKMPGLDRVTKFFGWVEGAQSLVEIATTVSNLAHGDNLSREQWIGLGINVLQVASQVVQTIHPATRPLLYFADAALKWHEVLHVDKGQKAGAQLETLHNVAPCNPAATADKNDTIQQLQDLIKDRQTDAEQQLAPLSDIPNAIPAIEQNLQAILDWLRYDELPGGDAPLPSAELPSSPTRPGTNALDGLRQEIERANRDLRDIGFTPNGPNPDVTPFWRDAERVNDLLNQVTDFFTAPIVGAGVNGAPSTACGVFWMAEYNDAVLRGRTTDGRIGFTTPPDTVIRLTLYDAAANTLGAKTVISNAAGRLTNFGTIALWPLADEVDTDGDGLVDLAEHVIGTNQLLADSDRDGVSDRAEVLACADPLGGRGMPNGVVGSIILRGTSEALVLAGSTTRSETMTAYVATGQYGLGIVDISQFGTPTIVSELDLPGTAVDIGIDESLALVAVASGAGGLHVVDVSNAANPRLLYTIAINATQVEVFEGTAFVAMGSVVRAYDLLTGERLGETINASPIKALARDGLILYALDGRQTLRSWQIEGGQLLARGSLSIGGSAASLSVGGGLATVGMSSLNRQGFVTVDIRDPNALRLISGVDDLTIISSALATTGSGLLVSGGQIIAAAGRVNAIDISSLADTGNTGNRQTRFVLPQAPRAIAISAGIAFVAAGSAGLQVVNYLAADSRGVAPTISFEPQSLDMDPALDGIQVLEGSAITLQPVVADDVQVRNVELLVNGQVVRNDTGFPFELGTTLPTLAANGGMATVTVQLRATDTGGNSGSSSAQVVTLVPDTQAPTLLVSSITEGATRSRSLRTINLVFSEALAQSTVNAQTVRLVGPDGQAVPPENFQFRQLGREVQVTYGPLALTGAYELQLDAPTLTDRAGNPLGAAPTVTRFTLQTYSTEWIGPSGGFWDVAANWSTGIAPGADDDVYIGLPAGGSITVRNGTWSVATLTSDASVLFTAGNLTVGGEAMLRSGLRIDGGSVTLRDDSIITGGLQLFGGTLTANAGLDVDTLLLADGILTGTGQVQVATASRWTGGVINGSGTLAFLGDLAIDGPQNKYLLGGRIVDTLGMTTWSGATATNTNDFYTGPSTINNTGTWIDNNAFNTIVRDWYSGDAAVFNNAGSYVKRGSSTSTVEMVFNNLGTLDVQGGALRLGSGGTAGAIGSLNIGAGANLRLQGGDFTLDGTTIAGTGRFEVSGAFNTTTSVVHTGNTAFAGELALTGGTLFANGAFNAARYAQSANYAFLDGTGAVTISGAAVWSDGNMQGSGSIDFLGDLAITGTAEKAIRGGRVINTHGTTTWSGATAANTNDFYTGPSTINNTGAWIDNNAFNTIVRDWDSGLALVFNNTGSYRKLGASTSTMQVTFNNAGLLDVQAGRLVLARGGASTGTTAVAVAAELALESGDHAWNAGTTVSVLGTLAVQGTGKLLLHDAVSLEKILLGNGGTLGGSGTLTITGTGSQWTGGTMNGGGTTTVAAGADLTISGASRKYLGTRTIDNHGSLIDTSTGDHVELDGLATLRNSGLFEIRGDAGWRNYTGAAGALTIDNTGTLRKQSDAGQFEMLGTVLNNTGLVEIAAGTLAIGGASGNAGTSSGEFSVAAGAELAFLAGTQTWVDGAQATGDGMLALRNLNGSTGATLAVTGANVAVQRIHLGTLGILGGDGTLTILGTGSLWSAGTMSGGGTTRIAAVADFTVTGSQRKYLGARALDNQGTLIEATSGDRVEFDGAATLTNGGTFEIRSNGTWGTFTGVSGSLALTNTGTLRKTLGLGGFAFTQTTLTNTGVVDVLVGRILVNGAVL